MNSYYVDLHVHIGRSSGGIEIKKATANNLSFENIAYESLNRKGIDVIGVVDCISPFVIKDIEILLEKGEIKEKTGGGMEYLGGTTLILGSEIETHEKLRGSAHTLCFFKTFDQLKAFSSEMKNHVKNIETVSSMSRLTLNELYGIVNEFNGLFIPAHAFTPHKSIYGNCVKSMHDIFDMDAYVKIPAIELGLSSDAQMASQLPELDGKSFLSNSDAHSLAKIGREYNQFQMESPSFDEMVMALKGINGRSVKANYGLNPRLGKYHRSFCLTCDKVIVSDEPILKCPESKRHRVVTGVWDRLQLIKGREPDIKGRPPYFYQIPLEFIPKLGPKSINKLIGHFGSEMKILHTAGFDDISAIVGMDIARNIIMGREGKLCIEAGGGGVYGKLDIKSK